MGKSQLLFVTHVDENIEEGISYAIELAKAMCEDITLLLVRKKNKTRKKLEDLMTAVTFAEADEHDTARRFITDGPQSGPERCEKMLTELVEKCAKEGIHVAVHNIEQDAVSSIRSFLMQHNHVDKVVLSPSVVEAGSVTDRDLNRLVRTASRPIVTMTRQATFAV
jgi:predicted amidohydrolase YtcJ